MKIKFLCLIFAALCPILASAQDSIPGVLNGHEWIDLGLSVNWATYNLGADTTDDYGDLYQWGNRIAIYRTRESDRDAIKDCAAWNKKLADISGNIIYDAASANWGMKWRIPTVREWRELQEKCTWEPQYNELKWLIGFRIIGPNGNSITLPSTSYWSSSPDDRKNAYCIDARDENRQITIYPRFWQIHIRPVTDK